MNIHKLINLQAELPTQYYDDKLNNILITQLFISAVSDDEIKFNNILDKNLNFWNGFSLYFNYDLEIEGNTGQAIIGDDDNYSFLHFICEHLPEKYICPVIEKAFSLGYESISQALENPNYKQNFINALIMTCITFKKPGALEIFLNHDFLNEQDIHDNLYFYNYSRLKSHVNLELQTQTSEIFNTWKKMIDTNIFSTNKSIETLKNITELLGDIPFIENKKEVQDTLFSMMSFKNFHFPYGRLIPELWTKDIAIKNFISTCIEHDIIDFYTPAKFTENKLEILDKNFDETDQSIKAVFKLFNISPDEMESIYSKKLQRKLNLELPIKNEISKIKI